MDGINVISINPGQTTRAAMHPEVFERIARECRLNTPRSQSRHLFRDSLNVILGINGKVSAGMSSKLLTLRLIMGGGLIALGAAASSLGLSHLCGVVCMAYGGLLIAGLTSRLASIATLAYFGATAVISALGNNLETITLLPILVSVIFSILGPGFYSCDQLTRKSLLRASRKTALRKKMQQAQDRMSYRAFASANNI